MSYIILKHTTIQGIPRTILVNDSEGISMEFDSLDYATKLAELFQANTTSGNIYEVKELK
jgi:hypothetical protein